MPPLAAGSVSLRNADTGLDITIFSVDPTRYDPFNVAKRGSSHPVLSGSVIHQDFGLKQADFIISLDVPITDYVTAQALFTKYMVRGGQWELRDWFTNRFRVIFAPGQAAYRMVPIPGSCSSFEVSMTFYVLSVLEWFSGGFA